VALALVTISLLYSRSNNEEETNSLSSSHISESEEKSQLQTAIDKIGGWTLNINEGTISPTSSSSENDLVLGVTDNPQLILTKKGSPGQLIFSIEELMNIQSNSNSNNGTILHGIGIQNSHMEPTKDDKRLYYEGSAADPTNEGSPSVMLEYINQTYLVLRSFNNNNGTVVTDMNMVLHVLDSEFSEGTTVDFVGPNLEEREEGEELHLVADRGSDWTLNITDGSISPRLRPDLVLGCGQRYVILSHKDSSRARRFRNLSKLQNGESALLQFATTLETDDDSKDGNIDEIGIGLITSQTKYFYHWRYMETKLISKEKNNNDPPVTVRYDNNNRIFMSSLVDEKNNDGSTTTTAKAALLLPFLFKIEDGTRIIFVEIE